MSSYRRLYVPGGTWFFTVRLADRRSTLLTDEIEHLRACFRIAQKQLPFQIDAAVVLPDHLHMIWTLPPNDADFSARWRMIKSAFSRHLPAPPHLSERQLARGEKGIWQKRFWEHRIRDTGDFARHRQLILDAPVVAGLAAGPFDWAYSSVHRDLRHGARVGPTAGPGFRGRSGQDPTYPIRPAG